MVRTWFGAVSWVAGKRAIEGRGRIFSSSFWGRNSKSSGRIQLFSLGSVGRTPTFLPISSLSSQGLRISLILKKNWDLKRPEFAGARLWRLRGVALPEVTLPEVTLGVLSGTGSLSRS